MKNMMLVMMYTKKTNVGEMFAYNFDKEIKLEVIKNGGKYGDLSELSRKVIFDDLKIDEILNYLVKTIDDLYEPTLEVYTICESGKNYILNVLEALKQRCGVPFTEELQQKWNSVIDIITKSKYVYDSSWDYMSIADTRNKFREIMGKKEDELCNGHKHAHKCGCHHTEPKENIKKGEIPKSLDCFTSMSIYGDIVGCADVFMGKIKGEGVSSIKDFFNSFTGNKTEINRFLITSKDLEYLFGKILKLLKRDKDVIINQNKLGDFVSKCIIVDSNMLFEDRTDFTPLELASKFLEKDVEEVSKSIKDEILKGKKASVVMTSNPNFSINLKGAANITNTEIEVSKLIEVRTKICKSFGIDESKEYLVSCIIRNPKDEDDSILKVKKDASEFLGLIEIVGIDKIYVDSKLKDKRDVGLLVKEIKDVYNNLEVVYVDIQE